MPKIGQGFDDDAFFNFRLNYSFGLHVWLKVYKNYFTNMYTGSVRMFRLIFEA